MKSYPVEQCFAVAGRREPESFYRRFCVSSNVLLNPFQTHSIEMPAMNLTWKRSLIGVALLLALPLSAWSIDTVELATGATAQGAIKSYSGESIVIDVKVGTRTIQRTYPKNRVKAIIVNGMHIDMKSGSTTTVSPGGVTERSRSEVLAEIDRLGKTPPDWFESTPLDYPKTLDLSWPMPAPKGWDSSRNVGQFLWDRINPNANKWHEGVRFMHHILSVSKDTGVQKRAMRSLGSMYHNLLQDHARSADRSIPCGLLLETRKQTDGTGGTDENASQAVPRDQAARRSW
jgi:hypothetical protein